MAHHTSPHLMKSPDVQLRACRCEATPAFPRYHPTTPIPRSPSMPGTGPLRRHSRSHPAAIASRLDTANDQGPGVFTDLDELTGGEPIAPPRSRPV